MCGGQSWGKKGPGKDLCLAKSATNESVIQCLWHCLYKRIIHILAELKGNWGEMYVETSKNDVSIVSSPCRKHAMPHFFLPPSVTACSTIPPAGAPPPVLQGHSHIPLSKNSWVILDQSFSLSFRYLIATVHLPYQLSCFEKTFLKGTNSHCWKKIILGFICTMVTFD